MSQLVEAVKASRLGGWHPISRLWCAVGSTRCSATKTRKYRFRRHVGRPFAFQGIHRAGKEVENFAFLSRKLIPISWIAVPVQASHNSIPNPGCPCSCCFTAVQTHQTSVISQLVRNRLLLLQGMTGRDGIPTPVGHLRQDRIGFVQLIWI